MITISVYNTHKGLLCVYIDGFEHLNFTTNRCSFFIHLIDENDMQLKYNNYVTFSHFYGKAVNNLSKIKLYKCMKKRNNCCS